MNTFKFFEVKSFRIYADTDVFGRDNVRYRRIFNYPASSYLYTELILINKQFGRKDWDLELEFVISKDIDPESIEENRDFIISKLYSRTVLKTEAEVKIVQKQGIKELLPDYESIQILSASYISRNKTATFKRIALDNIPGLSKSYNPYFSVG